MKTAPSSPAKKLNQHECSFLFLLLWLNGSCTGGRRLRDRAVKRPTLLNLAAKSLSSRLPCPFPCVYLKYSLCKPSGIPQNAFLCQKDTFLPFVFWHALKYEYESRPQEGLMGLVDGFIENNYHSNAPATTENREVSIHQYSSVFISILHELLLMLLVF